MSTSLGFASTTREGFILIRLFYVKTIPDRGKEGLNQKLMVNPKYPHLLFPMWHSQQERFDLLIEGLLR